MYGGVMAEAVTRVMNGIPVVVSFCGTDLLGGPFFNPLRRVTLRLGVFCILSCRQKGQWHNRKIKKKFNACASSVC